MSNKIDETALEQVLKDIRWNRDGLVPAVVQDVESGQVLMLAYMNAEALKRTVKEGRACYYSRSRQSLWLKGETSGHFQEVVDLRFDCDRDAVLLLVKQTGVACHENYFSCFHNKIAVKEGEESGEPQEQENDGLWTTVGERGVRPDASLGRIMETLAETIRQRNLERPEGSYTTYLFTKGLDKILKKVGEECAEVIIAAKNNAPDEIRYETADLLYHLLVLLEDRKIGLEEIAAELGSRRGKKSVIKDR
ncbi:MAG: bifunctional phosphoribosyl-AMP cyclohydrolase/phosphoribosyl-ATP diphosphatase HisIE [Peptococcaceae bacterium]|nr:bifunctional phosphoribosyl-AMP cyclohydrolase/phosphoribosyl-ATP diphosphatase HisIE [Peptococcaceae bacterium]